VTQHLEKPIRAVEIYPGDKTNISDLSIALGGDNIQALSNGRITTFLSKSYPNLRFIGNKEKDDAILGVFGKSEGHMLYISTLEHSKEVLELGLRSEFISNRRNEGAEEPEFKKLDLERGESSDPQKSAEEYKRLALLHK
jgi:hypothetical protein